jgi:hypothetical protein
MDADGTRMLFQIGCIVILWWHAHLAEPELGTFKKILTRIPIGVAAGLYFHMMYELVIGVPVSVPLDLSVPKLAFAFIIMTAAGFVLLAVVDIARRSLRPTGTL